MDILIIRFSSLGDVILASAVVEAIIRANPESRITFLTKSRYAPVFEEDERVAQVVGIEDGQNPRDIVMLIGRKRFDTIIDLHSSLRSLGIRMQLSSPLSMTVKKHNLARRFMILTRNRYWRHFDVLGAYLDTLLPLGIEGRVLPRILTTPRAVSDAGRLLEQEDLAGGKIIGIAPGSLHETKRWDVGSFAAVADSITERGDIPIFVGDTADRDVIDHIRSLMNHQARSVAGELSLSGVVGLISRFDGMVTNDSGPMHIAGAIGTPFVAVFGPTHPNLGFCPGYPRGKVLCTNEPCSPCSLHGAAPCRMPSQKCMEGITASMVLDNLYSIVT